MGEGRGLGQLYAGLPGIYARCDAGCVVGEQVGSREAVGLGRNPTAPCTESFC